MRYYDNKLCNQKEIYQNSDTKISLEIKRKYFIMTINYSTEGDGFGCGFLYLARSCFVK